MSAGEQPWMVELGHAPASKAEAGLFRALEVEVLLSGVRDRHAYCYILKCVFCNLSVPLL